MGPVVEVGVGVGVGLGVVLVDFTDEAKSAALAAPFELKLELESPELKTIILAVSP